MQNVKKSLSIKILASFTLLFLLISIFANFFERKAKMLVSANYTYTSATFNSSNLILVRLGHSSSSSEFDFDDLNTSWFSNAIYFNFSFKVDYDSSTDSVVFYVKGLFNDNNYLFDSVGSNQNDTFANIGNYNITNSNLKNNITRVWYSGTNIYYTPILFNFEYYDKDSGVYMVPSSNTLVRPSLVINQIIFGNYSDFSRMNFAYNSLYGSHLDNGQYNFISLVDSSGFRFTYFIPLCTNSSENVENSPANYLTYRKYLTENAINLGDNSAYQQGYQDGYNTGVGDGNGQGYQDGYDIGLTEGYNNGYSVGVEHGGKYTFNSLLGAVVDVPVRSFTSLFNFELLGVNLAGFFSGLLTLAVILTIVKMIKGG